VERLAQMQHLRAEVPWPPVQRVVLPLPVERGLEGVLDGERPALDEEQVGQRRVAEHPLERLDELGHLRGVDVGVGRLVDRHPGELGEERGVAGERRVVHAQRCRGEEAEHVEPPRAVARVDQPRPAARARVEHEVEAVDEHVPAQDLEDLRRVDPACGDGHGRSVRSVIVAAQRADRRYR
jgi:hypothetical protein